VAARLLEELRVLADLTADERAEPGHDVAAEAAASYDDTEYLTLDLAHPVTRDVLGRDDQHD